MKLKNFSLAYGTQIFKSFSDESRVRILFLLYTNREMCISDLEKVLDFTQTKTSRHLIYLKNARIVNTRRHDQWTFYYIIEEVSDIISQIFSFLHKDTSLQQDLSTYQVLYSNRELAINKLESKKWIK